MLRTFLAIPLPESIKNYLTDLSRQMQSLYQDQHDRLKWVVPEGMHITLAFLGDTREEDIDPLADQLAVTLRHFIPFRLTLTESGTFPHANKPRILWVGTYTDDEQLPAVKADVDRHLSGAGYTIEKRKFSPHITLGRIKRLVRNSNLVHNYLSHSVTALSFEVADIVWYQSILRPEGAEYSILKRFALGTEA